MITWKSCCTIGPSAGTREIYKFIAWRLPFAAFCELNQKVQLPVVKTLKLVIYFSLCGVPSNIKIKTCGDKVF
jgi:hypothetical protein